MTDLIKKIEALGSYEVIDVHEEPELNSMALRLMHKKTRALIAVLLNDDKNKVFYIGFRTPPTDSTGVAHIIEHTVLCGSKKYPVKDPFIELAKGSLNTFLNAMTYPDKTVYPVASCNDKDFCNLMDVYLDAVFHPNIYREEKIFKQEGWHYELQSPEDDLTINGVVYNEMKGAFSSPDDVLERQIMNGLFPDTTYSVESGGDPEVIPKLTYEAYLDFHRTYYHPSNSYIYLYGDLDLVERLAYLDREYLSEYDYLEVDSEVKWQAPFAEPRSLVLDYPITENDKMTENTYLSYSTVAPNNLDKEEYLAFQILDYALCSSPAAPVKRALLDAGIGHDVYGEYDNGILQPVFSIIAKEADETQLDDFLRIIQEELTRQCDQGIDKKSLEAGLNYYEFRYREADFGSYPKGLLWGLQVLDSWIYAEDKPFHHLVAGDTFVSLREKLNTDYYEQLIRTRILDNPHKLILTLKPVQGLTTEKDQKLAEALAKKKAAFSEEEIAQMVEQTHALTAYQEEEEDPALLSCIPLLSIEDIDRNAEPVLNEVTRPDGMLFLHHSVFTNGIGYFRLMFDVRKVPNRLLPALGMLKSFFGLMNTEHYTYGELDHEINIKSGGISPSIQTYLNNLDKDEYLSTFEISCKTLLPNLEASFGLIREMILYTKYNDPQRLREQVTETLSVVRGLLISNSHSVAINRALSYGSEQYAVNEIIRGLDYERRLEQLDQNFAEEAEQVIRDLEEVCTFVFRPENMMLDYTGDEESAQIILQKALEFRQELYTGTITEPGFDVTPVRYCEGFMSAGQVQYVCCAGNYRKNGLRYTGVSKVLKVMLGYDFLWNQVRVKGGAYGCMFELGRNGNIYFASYRDPNLQRTIDVFEKVADFVEQFDADERTLTQYIIGAVASLDIPKTPHAKGAYGRVTYLSNITFEEIQKDRNELLDATVPKIRELAAHIRAAMEDKWLCVVGGEQQIQDNKDLFGVTTYLVP